MKIIIITVTIIFICSVQYIADFIQFRKLVESLKDKTKSLDEAQKLMNQNWVICVDENKAYRGYAFVLKKPINENEQITDENWFIIGENKRFFKKKNLKARNIDILETKLNLPLYLDVNA